MKNVRKLLAIMLAFTVIATACGSDEETPTATTAAPTTAAPEAGAHLGDGSLGEVRVDAGEAIQIRSLNAISGDVAFLGIPNENGIRMAVEDYGQIKGFDVDLGTGMDDLCSADGGQAAASIIVADEDIVGVIGTSCSGAAAAASPLISEAGLVMISGSNTSPSLTSDLAGTAGASYQSGYYRTAHNDLYQGAAAAEFALTVLGVTTAAAIHDGDPYTEGLATAFTDAFEAGGGTVTGFTAVNKGDTDMVPVLTEIAAGAPEMLFFPIFQPEGDFIVQQAGDVSGMGGVVLMAADGLLNSNFLAVAETEGMYFSGPDVRYGANANQSTGETASDVLADYNTEFGEAPAAPFWAHSYDAAALLMDAIAAASYMDGDTLVIDRAGVREHLNGVSGYDGLIGNLSCDAYGDCSSSKITVIQNTDTADYEASTNNVVFEYAPTGSQAGNDIVAAADIIYDYGVTEDTIRVGALADLSGVFAPLVIQIMDAQQAYWDMVNENGGIAGRQVELLVEDTLYDVPTHLEKYEIMKDKDNGVVFISQSTGSLHTSAIAEDAVSDGLGIIPLSWYSGWPDPDFGQNIFESGTNYCYEAINAVDYLANNVVEGDAKLAILTFPGEYGQDAAAGAKIAAEALGIEIVYDAEARVVPGADQTPVISGLVDSGANFVWITASPSVFAEVFRGAVAQGFEAVWSGSLPTYNYMLLATGLAPALDAYYYQSGYYLTWNAGDSEGMTNMVAELQARIPDKPLSDVYTTGWTAAMATHQILEAAAAAGDLTRAGVIAAANSTDIDYQGLAANQSYSGTPNENIVRGSYMFDIQADLFDAVATVAGGGSTGSVLMNDGPILSDVTAAHVYDGACFKSE